MLKTIFIFRIWIPNLCTYVLKHNPKNFFLAEKLKLLYEMHGIWVPRTINLLCCRIILPIKVFKPCLYASYIFSKCINRIPLSRNKRFALNKMFQRNSSKLLYFMYKKTHLDFFVFHFVRLYIFTLWMPWSIST